MADEKREARGAQTGRWPTRSERQEAHRWDDGRREARGERRQGRQEVTGEARGVQTRGEARGSERASGGDSRHSAMRELQVGDRRERVGGGDCRLWLILSESE